MNSQIKVVVAVVLNIISGFQNVYGYNITASLDDELYLNAVPKWMLPLVYSQGKLEEDVRYLHEATIDNKNAIADVRQDMKQGFDKIEAQLLICLQNQTDFSKNIVEGLQKCDYPVWYGRSTLIALVTAMGAIKLGALGWMIGSRVSYVLSALFTGYVTSSLSSSVVPEKHLSRFDGVMNLLLTAGFFTMYLNQRTLAPQITLGNIASLAAIVGAFAVV
jgi:hypothetical protein